APPTVHPPIRVPASRNCGRARDPAGRSHCGTHQRCAALHLSVACQTAHSGAATSTKEAVALAEAKVGDRDTGLRQNLIRGSIQDPLPLRGSTTPSALLKIERAQAGDHLVQPKG